MNSTSPSPMPTRMAWLLAVAMLLAVTLAWTAPEDSTTPAQSSDTATADTALTDSSPEKPDTDQDSAATPEGTPPAATPQTLKSFKPSEEIGADSAVSFPIDI